MEEKLKKAFEERNPNAVSGIWNFWEINSASKLSHTLVVDGRFFIYEYQCGEGEDFSIKIR